MNLPVEDLSLSREKLRRMPLELNWGRPKNCTWVTWMQSATGAMREIM